MGQFRNYPAQPFNANQNFLARDPSGSGDVIRVNAQGILDAAVAEIQALGGQVLGIDTKTEALATDLNSGVYVVTGGDVSLFDGGEGVYRVSDVGSGGDSMANGNELVLLVNTAQVSTNTANIATNTAGIAANKQVYTSVFATNIYTVTPEINATVWPTLQAGLIIEFELSTTANTGAVSIDFNGTVDSLKWIDDSSLVSDDLDGDFTKQIRAKFNGTDWLVISDVAGSNADGDWDRRANGWAYCSRSDDYTDSISSAWGSVFISGILAGQTMPVTFSKLPKIENVISNGADLMTALEDSDPTVSLWGNVRGFRGATLASSTLTVTRSAAGRWYN